MALNLRLVALVTGIVGVAAICIAMAFQQLPEVKDAGSCFIPGAVLEFELATAKADLERIFGTADSACRPKALAAMDASNRFDVQAFIPTYTALHLLAVVFIAGGLRRPIAMTAAAAAVGALVADYVETLGLLRITQNLAAGEAMLATTRTAAWTKFALMSLHALLLAVVCLRAAPRRPILGVALFAPLPAFAGLLLFPASRGIAPYGYVVAWFAVVTAAFWTAARPAKAPASALT